MKHREYMGKKGAKEMKNIPTADVRKPDPSGGEQARGPGEEHSRTEEEAWGGVKRRGLRFQLKLM